VKVVIVGPTRELARQIGEVLVSLKHNPSEFSVLTAYGGEPLYLNLNQISKCNGSIDVIVGTPGRIIDLINRGILSFENLSTVCFDETDLILEYGYLDDLEKILKTLKREKNNFQMLCFTATLKKIVIKMTQKWMKADRVIF
jgi:ATP-dependent RNA helicase DeaD